MAKTKKKKQNILNSSLAMGLALVVGLVAATVYMDSREMLAQQQSYIMREEALEKQIRSEEERTVLLNEQKKRTQNTQYYEQVAKDKLGLVYPDEVILKAKDK